MTTARGIVENGLPAKTIQLRHFWIFLVKNSVEDSSINTLNNQKIKSLTPLFVFFQKKKMIEFSVFPLSGGYAPLKSWRKQREREYTNSLNPSLYASVI